MSFPTNKLQIFVAFLVNLLILYSKKSRKKTNSNKSELQPKYISLCSFAQLLKRRVSPLYA